MLYSRLIACSLLLYLVSFAQGQEKQSSISKDLEKLVLVESGELPILISAPHGGRLSIAGVEVREGKGMEKGPKGFFTGRDSGTEELAQEVVKAIEKRFGKKPYSVISATHRKFLDPNRPSHIAYENSDVKPVYDRYHHSMATFVSEILEKHRTGILLDLHGQGTSKETVYRGTGNGRTVERLRTRFSEEAHTGNQSFFGLLHSHGWKVFPDPFDGKEQAGFTGGYIVQTYGSHQPLGIDAMQLEMGADYRSKEKRIDVADAIAESLQEYCKLYVTKDAF